MVIRFSCKILKNCFPMPQNFRFQTKKVRLHGVCKSAPVVGRTNFLILFFFTGVSATKSWENSWIFRYVCRTKMFWLKGTNRRGFGWHSVGLKKMKSDWGKARNYKYRIWMCIHMWWIRRLVGYMFSRLGKPPKKVPILKAGPLRIFLKTTKKVPMAI